MAPAPAVARARLVTPDVRYRPSFLLALAEYHAEGSSLEIDGRRLADPDEFARYVAALRADAYEPGALWRYLRDLNGTAPWEPPKSGWAAQSGLWWVDGDEYLGRVNIRHRLTADLLRRGGHIGYSVRPGARGRGHATAMLAAALLRAAALGIDPAHIDCDADNLASRRVIEKNGGRLEHERDGSLYYLVPTRVVP